MVEKSVQYKRGEHPNSLAMLNRDGRLPAYGKRKPRHAVYVSDEAWTELNNVAIECGCRSVSDLLEKLGRGQVRAEQAGVESEKTLLEKDDLASREVKI